MATLSLPAGVGTDRRKLPRLPLALPVRYATEEGLVGIGVLIDVHEEGCGLLVPKITFDALQVWMQFLWFNDRVGLQGRVIFVLDIEEGFHVGLQLELVHPDSVAFLTNLLIPYSQRMAALGTGWRSRAIGSAGHQPHLPVLVSQEGISVWAITEHRDEEGAVLLMPRLPDAAAALALTTWGHPGARWATVVRSEKVQIPPVELFHVMVQYAEPPGELVRSTADQPLDVDDPAIPRGRPLTYPAADSSSARRSSRRR
jgi:hypothetical protein